MKKSPVIWVEETHIFKIIISPGGRWSIKSAHKTAVAQNNPCSGNRFSSNDGCARCNHIFVIFFLLNLEVSSYLLAFFWHPAYTIEGYGNSPPVTKSGKFVPGKKEKAHSEPSPDRGKVKKSGEESQFDQPPPR